MKKRIEKDSLGEIQIPIDALYGPQTQRAVENFNFSSYKMPKDFLISLLEIKKAAAKSNYKLKLISKNKCDAIVKSTEYLINNYDDKNFPVDVFQTGSGTSTNMNVNEVIARVAKIKFKTEVHPNDDINKCQSSNDVIPTCISYFSVKSLNGLLIPEIENLINSIKIKANKYDNVVKTGRTHLMDAMPITLKQELSAWATQIINTELEIKKAIKRLSFLPIGGTAIGSGINSHPNYSKEFIKFISTKKNSFFEKKDKFEGLSCQDDSIFLSSTLKSLAVNLTKISNDLRWMNSGPLSGLSEISLKSLQPGSSIMPGKINPVIPEATLMSCVKVISNDHAITMAGMSGNFQLNVMLPLIAFLINESIFLLSNSCKSLSTVIKDFKVNKENIDAISSINPILITALNNIIGYEKGAYIAKKAYKEKKPIIDIALSETSLSKKELEKLLNPKDLTKKGIK